MSQNESPVIDRKTLFEAARAAKRLLRDVAASEHAERLESERRLDILHAKNGHKYPSLLINGKWLTVAIARGKRAAVLTAAGLKPCGPAVPNRKDPAPTMDILQDIIMACEKILGVDSEQPQQEATEQPDEAEGAHHQESEQSPLAKQADALFNDAKKLGHDHHDAAINAQDIVIHPTEKVVLITLFVDDKAAHGLVGAGEDGNIVGIFAPWGSYPPPQILTDAQAQQLVYMLDERLGELWTKYYGE